MKQYKYTVNGADYDVTIDKLIGNQAKVIVNGIAFDVEMQGTLTEDELPDAPAVAGGASAPAAKPAAAPAAKPAAASAGTPGKGTPVKAPLPGVVTEIKAPVGTAVKKGDTVLVLEAMKMENNINAEIDGTVTSVCVAQGDSVMEGTVLMTIA